jgi:hypothetical protein
LQRLGLVDLVTPNHLVATRSEALQKAVDLVQGKQITA